MDLIERYLTTVSWDLPRDQRADITEELRDVLQSQVEEREAALGRPLEKKEVEQLLTDFGHPLVVAGRYRKVQQLIGPDAFPFWWATVRAAFAVMAAYYVVLIIINLLQFRGVEGLDHVSPDLGAASVYLFGAVTLVFVALEQFGGLKYVARWRPRDLPPPHIKRTSLFERCVEIGMGMVFLAWWTGVLHFADLFPGAAQVGLAMGPIWTIWYWPILIYASWGLAIDILAAARPGWVFTNRVLSLVRHLAAAGILFGLYRMGHWIEVTDSGSWSAAREVIQDNLNLGLRIGFGVATLVSLLQALGDVWKLVRDSSAPPAFRTGRAPG